MNVWRWCGALIILAVCGIGVTTAGGGKDKLEWKAFDKEGASFYQEMKTKTDQTMKVQGMDVKQTQNQTFYLKWTTLKNEKETWLVEQEIIGVKMDIQIGGNQISYDSTAKDQPANPLTDFFKALIGAKFKLTVNKKSMKVEKIEGRAEFVKNLAKANEQLKPLLEAILSDEALKQMTDPTFAVIPKDGVIPADKKWDNADGSVLNMGPIGKYTTKYKYVYEGPNKDKLDEIKVETTLTYEAPKEKSTGLPFIIKEAKLSSTKGTGKILFDREKGRIKSSTMDLELAGDLTIEIAGMQTNVTLNQTQNSTLTTMDTDPLKK
jgi:hypothetical protein